VEGAVPGGRGAVHLPRSPVPSPAQAGSCGIRTRLTHGHSRSHCQDNESFLQSALFRGSIARLLYPLSSDLRSTASRTLPPKPMHRTKGPHSLPVICSFLLDETHGFPWFSLGHLERFLLSSSFHELRIATWHPLRIPVDFRRHGGQRKSIRQSVLWADKRGEKSHRGVLCGWEFVALRAYNLKKAPVSDFLPCKHRKRPINRGFHVQNGVKTYRRNRLTVFRKPPVEAGGRRISGKVRRCGN
jgi:hypothetical protein